jgi:hypothetical protein
MNATQFKRKAEAAFKKANPTASIEWISAKQVTYPTGVKEYRGQFLAEAPGYRASQMTAMGDDSYVMVR